MKLTMHVASYTCNNKLWAWPPSPTGSGGGSNHLPPRGRSVLGAEKCRPGGGGGSGVSATIVYPS